MTWTAKLTWTRGKPNVGQIIKTAGSAEAGHDVISVNIDADKISRGDALIAIDNIKAALIKLPWPLN